MAIFDNQNLSAQTREQTCESRDLQYEEHMGTICLYF